MDARVCRNLRALTSFARRGIGESGEGVWRIGTSTLRGALPPAPPT